MEEYTELDQENVDEILVQMHHDGEILALCPSCGLFLSEDEMKGLTCSTCKTTFPFADIRFQRKDQIAQG